MKGIRPCVVATWRQVTGEPIVATREDVPINTRLTQALKQRPPASHDNLQHAVRRNADRVHQAPAANPSVGQDNSLEVHPLALNF